MSRNKNSTMTPAKYRRIVRALSAAYAALAEASETAEYFDNEVIVAAKSALSRVPDRLRVQVCANCSERGYYEKLGDPYRSWSCHHEAVPSFDVRIGVPTDRVGR